MANKPTVQRYLGAMIYMGPPLFDHLKFKGVKRLSERGERGMCGTLPALYGLSYLLHTNIAHIMYYYFTKSEEPATFQTYPKPMSRYRKRKSGCIVNLSRCFCVQGNLSWSSSFTRGGYPYKTCPCWKKLE